MSKAKFKIGTRQDKNVGVARCVKKFPTGGSKRNEILRRRRIAEPAAISMLQFSSVSKPLKKV